MYRAIIGDYSLLLRLGDDVPRVQHAWDPGQDGKTDVDEEVGAAALLQEHRNGRKEEAEEIEEHIALLRLLGTRLRVM